MKFKPVHYEIELDIDLDNLSFIGTTRVDIKLLKPTNKIDINALELDIQSIKLLNNEISSDVKSSYSLEKQLLTIELNKSYENDVSIYFEFIGKINDKLAGFYQSKYKVGEEIRTAAVTQFQESDARRAFPCFDEPGKKATFDITFIVKEGLTVISNGKIDNEEERGDKIAYSFERTPIMSTYLLFFGVGEFEYIEDYQDEIRHRVYASPGQAEKYGHFALNFAMKSLKFCQDYFKVPFPFSKMDQIATADFAHGAMENWSAILYRENYLLNFPGITSKRQETIIQMVIAHEITHQWFGNSTSPSTWKYIWLNESFATYFGFGVIDEYYREKNIWQLFLQIETAVALGADAYIETAAIEVPGEVAVGMTIKTAPIIYNKGGSILRMLEAFVGADAFKEGLRYYLEEFKYNVATSSDLWKSIEKVSGKQISSLMESWVLQPGFPLVTVEKEGNELTLIQSRFTYLDNSDETLWEIPVSITQYNESSEISTDYVILKEKQIKFKLSSKSTSYKLNKDFTGFFHVQYPVDNMDELGKLVSSKSLDSIDRWNLIYNYYALLRSADIDLDRYLDFINNYNIEDNYLSISSISQQLFSLYSLFEEDMASKIKIIGKVILENVLDRIGYDVMENESTDITSIRGRLIHNAVIFGSEKAEKYALDKFEKIRKGEEISADILINIIKIGAMKTNDAEFLINKFENAANEQENISYLNALGNFTDLKLIEDMQLYAFEKVPMRNRTTIIQGIIQNPKAKNSLWKWYLANLDNFEQLTEFMYQGVLVSLIPKCTKEFVEVKEFFINYLKKRPNLKDAIDIAMENIEINKKMLSQYN